MREYPIDTGRLLTTGQSGGCMTSLALGIARPDLFARTSCVGGQWDAAATAPLARSNLWVIVSEDDSKAFPGMTAIMEVLAANGARITRGQLDAEATPEVQAAEIADLQASADGSSVNFTTFAPGTVLDDRHGTGGAGHVNTWAYAYDIPAVPSPPVSRYDAARSQGECPCRCR
ncbi:hypothetical protein ACEYYB_12600 [Paracoccus sp. p4-l81]|uniref:hypothetical protein n=1 Tax=Paracoccus sp. p4-l81 TaxID=3342806 RepID=UPI0035B83F41